MATAVELTPRENALIFLGVHAAGAYPEIDAIKTVREFVAKCDAEGRFIGVTGNALDTLCDKFDEFVGEYIIK